MDGENNAKPYFLIDNLEGNTPFLETPKYTPIGNDSFFFSKEISPTDDGCSPHWKMRFLLEMWKKINGWNPGNDGFQVRNLRISKGPFSGEPCLFWGVYWYGRWAPDNKPVISRGPNNSTDFGVKKHQLPIYKAIYRVYNSIYSRGPPCRVYLP